ncbi:hypothetical protein B0H14DRAFT_3536436 [Mycena olivaceomarginata]|nr:hypothetical protein B0H14DRAFT_3536436 [Mycena olivaceomarginata]
MMISNAWRTHLRRAPKPLPRNTSFEYEHESERVRFRRLATPQSRSRPCGHSHLTPSPSESEALDDFDDESDDQSSAGTRDKHFVAKSHPSKTFFANIVSHLYSFIRTMVLGVLRLLLNLMCTFLEPVNHLVLQRICALALRLVGPLFVVAFVALLLIVLDLVLSTDVHLLHLPASPASNIAVLRLEGEAPRLDSELSRLDGTQFRRLEDALSGPQAQGSHLDDAQFRLLEDALSGLQAQANRLDDAQFRRLEDTLSGLQAQANRQSARTDEEIVSHTAASSQLKTLEKDVKALQLVAHTYRAELSDLRKGRETDAAETASQAAARSEINSLRRDLETVQLLVASQVAASFKINSLRSDVEVFKLLVEALQPQLHVSRPDFASHSSGASVLPSLTSDTYMLHPSSMSGKLWGFFTCSGYISGRPPVTALHYDIHNGHCWPFAGSYSQLGIVLGALIYIEAITIDHVAAAVAVNGQRSAPRDMEVWGLIEGHDNIAKVDAWRAQEGHEPGHPEIPPGSFLYPRTRTLIPRPEVLLEHPEYIRITSFQYDIHSPTNVQTFPVDAEIKGLGIDFSVAVLMVKSNWGMWDYTCLYRVRVHGRIMEAPGLPI